VFAVLPMLVLKVHMRCVCDGQAQESGLVKGHPMNVQKAGCKFLYLCVISQRAAGNIMFFLKIGVLTMSYV
jgi:hypothetical protein